MRISNVRNKELNKSSIIQHEEDAKDVNVALSCCDQREESKHFVDLWMISDNHQLNHHEFCFTGHSSHNSNCVFSQICQQLADGCS